MRGGLLNQFCMVAPLKLRVGSYPKKTGLYGIRSITAARATHSDSPPPFHLAFPVRDIQEAREFYGRWAAVSSVEDAVLSLITPSSGLSQDVFMSKTCPPSNHDSL